MITEVVDALRGNPMSAAQIAERLGIKPDASPIDPAYAALLDKLQELRASKMVVTAVDNRETPREHVIGPNIYRYYLMSEGAFLEARGILGPEYDAPSFPEIAEEAFGRKPGRDGITRIFKAIR